MKTAIAVIIIILAVIAWVIIEFIRAPIACPMCNRFLPKGEKTCPYCGHK